MEIPIEEDLEEIKIDPKSNKVISKKEYFNKLSIERINFKFEEYEMYPEINLKPSIFFFKFLCSRPDSNKDCNLILFFFKFFIYLAIKKIPKLKINIPDTIVKNDSEPHYWIYTDETGSVVRMEQTNDSEIVQKFKSTVDDPNEVISVFKAPNMFGSVIDDNLLKLLNQEELERYLYSKHPGNLFNFIVNK